MTSSPWLTIITVVKDDPEGLERTLGSLKGVNLDTVEHLIIDSSMDQSVTTKLVSATGLSSRVLWSDPAGVYAAMNKGLADSSGQFVYFLNAGDELASPDVIPALRDLLSLSGAAWLDGAVEIVGSDKSVVVTPEWNYADERAWAFARGRFPAHQGTVARTSALRSIGGFDTSFSIAADYAAFLRLSQLGEPARFPSVIARFYEGGISTKRWARSLREFHRARREILHPTGIVAVREQWATARQFVAAATYRSPWPVAGLLALLGVVLMGATGVSWWDALLLTAIVAVQGVGGALWWRMLRPQRRVPILEVAGMGLGLGTASAMLTGLFVAWWLAPALAAAAWLVVRRRLAPLAPLSRPDVLALGAGLIPGVAALVLAFRTYPLAWVGEYAGYHGDMPFFEALSVSVARLGPVSSMLMDGAQLRYHSLAYAWAGELSLAIDAEPFVVLTRLLPYVGLVAAIALAAAWTRQLTRVWWAPSLAVLLVITGGFVGATYGSVLNMDSPSQTVGAVWLLALSILLIQSLTNSSLPWSILAMTVLVIALTGGKISTAAIAAAGFAVVVVTGVIRREEWWRRAVVLGIVGAAALLGTYVWLLAGSANAGGLGIFSLLDRASSVQGLNPVVTPRGIVVGIALLMIAVLPRWAGLTWLIGDRKSRWEPTTLYGIGLALGGLGTIAILSGGFNDLWFAVAASAPLAVLSATGTAAAVTWLGSPGHRHVLLAFVWGLVVSAIVAALWASGSTGIIGIGWRWAGPLVGLLLALLGALILARGLTRHRLQSVVALGIIILVTSALPARFIYAVAEKFSRSQTGSASAVLFTTRESFIPTRDQDREISWTDSQAAAGAWLRANAQVDDIIATNLTLGALVPSLTRLTAYVSNIHMQAPYGLVEDLPIVQQREADSWAFIDRPSEETIIPLCDADVTWVWVDASRTTARDWRPFADILWQSQDVLILRLNPEKCPQ